MPVFISSLVSAFSWLFRNDLGRWISAGLAWFGLAWATSSFVVDPWIDNLTQHISGSTPAGEWGAVLVQYAGLMQFDTACTMIASAVVTRFGVNAAQRAFLVRKAG